MYCQSDIFAIDDVSRHDARPKCSIDLSCDASLYDPEGLQRIKCAHRVQYHARHKGGKTMNRMLRSAAGVGIGVALMMSLPGGTVRATGAKPPSAEACAALAAAELAITDEAARGDVDQGAVLAKRIRPSITSARLVPAAGAVPEWSGASPRRLRLLSGRRRAGPGSETAPGSDARRAGRDEAGAAPASSRAAGRAN